VFEGQSPSFQQTCAAQAAPFDGACAKDLSKPGQSGLEVGREIKFGGFKVLDSARMIARDPDAVAI